MPKTLFRAITLAALLAGPSAILPVVPAGAQTAADGPLQISWEVRNRFRLFREERDFLLHVEAARNAIKAKGGAAPNSEEVKNGMEAIKGFTLGGLVPPMEITAADHEGGGWVQIWTVKGGKLVRDKDWFQGYREIIKKHLAAEASKS